MRHIKDCQPVENWRSCPPCVKSHNETCYPGDEIMEPQEQDLPVKAEGPKLYHVIRDSGKLECIVSRGLKIVLRQDKGINKDNIARAIQIVACDLRGLFEQFTIKDVSNIGTRLKIEELNKELKETKHRLNKQRKHNGDLRRLLEKCNPSWRDMTKDLKGLKDESETPII